MSLNGLLSIVAKQLEDGYTVTTHPRGNSMVPIIKSGQRVVITPCTEPVKGDVVLAKVHGRFMLHKVTAVQHGRFQISNNHGLVNGWTDKIYGKVTEIGG